MSWFGCDHHCFHPFQPVFGGRGRRCCHCDRTEYGRWHKEGHGKHVSFGDREVQEHPEWYTLVWRT